MLGLPAPARAETALGASIASDDWFRGGSTSGGRPVGNLALGYDDVRGPYLGISFTGVATGNSGLKPLRSIQYIGYAKRVDPAFSLDIGLTHRSYARHFTGEYGRNVTEGYVGLIGRRLSSHIFYSPDYDGYGGGAVYGQVDALLFDRGDWSISGHAGALLAPRQSRSRPIDADWRLGLSRRFGRTAISLNYVGATPSHHDRGARGTVLFSAGRSF